MNHAALESVLKAQSGLANDVAGRAYRHIDLFLDKLS